jgi:hypothetical protein
MNNRFMRCLPTHVTSAKKQGFSFLFLIWVRVKRDSQISKVMELGDLEWL